MACSAFCHHFCASSPSSWLRLRRRCPSAIAVATCVLTCTSWLRMSSCSCRRVCSGSSAFSIIVLRLARSKVSTRSNKFISISHVLFWYDSRGNPCGCPAHTALPQQDQGRGKPCPYSYNTTFPLCLVQRC